MRSQRFRDLTQVTCLVSGLGFELRQPSSRAQVLASWIPSFPQPLVASTACRPESLGLLKVTRIQFCSPWPVTKSLHPDRPICLPKNLCFLPAAALLCLVFKWNSWNNQALTDKVVIHSFILLSFNKYLNIAYGARHCARSRRILQRTKQTWSCPHVWVL